MGMAHIVRERGLLRTLPNMAVIGDLKSVGLIERDHQGDVLWTWSYPSITDEERNSLIHKCCLKQEGSQLVPFVFGRLAKNWFYIYTSSCNSEALKRVNAFSVALVTKDFQPEKYESFTKILSDNYSRTGSPATLLESYLAVATRGKCKSHDNGVFVSTEFDPRHAFVAASVKDAVRPFGLEIILLYTALLLKKRVAVYHSDVEELLRFTRALPCLVWHRKNWSILYPYVHLEDDLAPMTSSTTYVIGSTQPEIENRTDLYDVFVSLPTYEIQVAPEAKEAMVMCKLQKDIALTLVQLVEEEGSTEQQVIKGLNIKTKELLTNLRSLATGEEDGKLTITLDTLRQRKMAPSTQNFLFNLAAAEGLLKV